MAYLAKNTHTVQSSSCDHTHTQNPTAPLIVQSLFLSFSLGGFGLRHLGLLLDEGQDVVVGGGGNLELGQLSCSDLELAPVRKVKQDAGLPSVVDNLNLADQLQIGSLKTITIAVYSLSFWNKS